MIETIPVMTDPLGRHWEQPDPEDILVDDKHALMSLASFEKIRDYSRSEPTALYAGKMWKTQNGLILTIWYLHFVTESESADKVWIHARQIILVD